MPNWDEVYKKVTAIMPEVNEIVDRWKYKYPMWSGYCICKNYPPGITGVFGIIHLSNLSDARLQEIGELTTSICEAFHMTGRAHHTPRTSEVTFTLWFPINEDVKNEQ